MPERPNKRRSVAISSFGQTTSRRNRPGGTGGGRPLQGRMALSWGDVRPSGSSREYLNHTIACPTDREYLSQTIACTTDREYLNQTIVCATEFCSNPKA